MHTARMPTKTISLRLDAYERLRAARATPDESFSQVVLRAKWPASTVTGAELLRLSRARAPSFTEAELDFLDEIQAQDSPPEDKWKT